MKRTKGFVVAVSVLFSVSTTAVHAEDTVIIVRESGINRSSIYWRDDDSLLVAGMHSECLQKDNSGWHLLRFRVLAYEQLVARGFDIDGRNPLGSSNGHIANDAVWEMCA